MAQGIRKYILNETDTKRHQKSQHSRRNTGGYKEDGGHKASQQAIASNKRPRERKTYTREHQETFKDKIV